MHTEFSSVNFKEGHHLGYLGLYGGIILKWNLKDLKRIQRDQGRI